MTANENDTEENRVRRAINRIERLAHMMEMRWADNKPVPDVIMCNELRLIIEAMAAFGITPEESDFV